MKSYQVELKELKGELYFNQLSDGVTVGQAKFFKN